MMRKHPLSAALGEKKVQGPCLLVVRGTSLRGKNFNVEALRVAEGRTAWVSRSFQLKFPSLKTDSSWSLS
jgi:hypothetical protein